MNSPSGRLSISFSGGRLELGDSVEVAVGVLEPGHAILAQCGDPLLVRLDPITLDLLEADAVGGELVHGALEVVDLPGGDRATRLACVGGRGVDVDLAAPAARIGDPAVADIPASRKAELALVELLRFGHVRHRQRRLDLCVTQTHFAPPAGTRSWSERPPSPSSDPSYRRGRSDSGPYLTPATAYRAHCSTRCLTASTAPGRPY